MKFRFAHQNFNVLNLDRSLAFYRDALGLAEVRRIVPAGGEFIIVYLGDGESDFVLELTWMRDRKEPYNLGDEEFHLAFTADDYKAARAKHAKMNCIAYENEAMGIYFIQDPEGMRGINKSYRQAA